MKQIFRLFVCSMTLWVLVAVALASQQTRIWTLVEVLDENGQSRLDKANSASGAVWKGVISYARDAVRGSVIQRQTYTGPTQNQFKPPHVTGSYYVTTTTWSSPPKSLQPNKEAALKVATKVSERSHTWPQPMVNVAVQLVNRNAAGQYVSHLRYFVGEDKKTTIALGAGNQFAPISTTVKALVGANSKDGERMGIKVTVSNGNMVTTTTYVYQWGLPIASPPVLKNYSSN